MQFDPHHRVVRVVHILKLLAVAAFTAYFFALPGATVVRDLADSSIRQPGIPHRAWALHRDLAPKIDSWARERVQSGSAANVALHDVPTTEWPLFTAVFYLMATDALQTAWQSDPSRHREPMSYARAAVTASRDLLMDPNHHSWVKRHWGDGYLHRENVFFRSLLIAGLTSYESLTRDGSAVPLLTDQIDTLSRSLDQSQLGILNDYPGECYPIDVVAAIGFIQRADAVLGTDHKQFVARSIRAFEGPMADSLGLVPYRVVASTGMQEQPSRGIGNSWVSVFAPTLWPDRARDWYARYEQGFWQNRVWAAGFREFARGSGDADWQVEVDAGPVIDGFGTSASAFGIGAARRNGRFDHAYTLASQMLAISWPLPSGTMLAPRVLSHATDAPYLGESGILFFLTVNPPPDQPVRAGGSTPAMVWAFLAMYFGVTAAASFWIARGLRRCLGRPATA